MPLSDPFPGRTSPLFLGALIVGTYLYCRQNEESDPHIDHRFNVLSIAATALMTTNTTARCAAVVGGMMQLYRSSTSIATLGVVLQAGALGFSMRESQQARTGTMPRPYRR